MKKSPLKKKPFKAKRSPLKKFSQKKLDEIASKTGNLFKMHDLFYEIWNKKVHKCEACGNLLGDEMKSFHFDHLMEKSKYPELAFEELNIFICCLSCHERKTNGFPKPKHKEAIERAKELFGY